MSKIVYLCFNNKRIERNLNRIEVFELLSHRLVPHNITPNPVKVIKFEGIAASVINPANSIKIKGASVCLGALIKPYNKWYEPLAEIPDGNYALIRGNKNTIEVLTDVVASRTIWYYYDMDIFIASTSQRAIVIMLRSFSLNKSAVTWMLSSGTLGYKNSWDRRIKKLQGDSRIVLDRNSWKLDVHEKPVLFEPSNLSITEAITYIRDVYEDTFQRLELTPSTWLMALSGGHDSRLVFMLLKDKIDLECVSWGLKEALNDKFNDAFIARELAKLYGCKFEYFEVKTKEEHIENSLVRLLISGEGRTDNVQAYMDAFHSWKTFFDMGVNGIIRGDVAVNSRAIINEVQGRKLQKLTLLKDYKEYSKIFQFGFEPQEIHEDLKKRKDESLILYSFRLHHLYNLPYAIAAWSDIVSPYVEVINPLLSKSIVYAIRNLPENLLYLKKVHKMIVETICSDDIRYAKKTADEPIIKVLYNPFFAKYLSSQLDVLCDNSALDEGFLNIVKNNIQAYEVSGSNPHKQMYFFLTSSFKRMISIKNKQKMSAFVKNTVDFNRIALRCFIILKMYNILQEDARALDSIKLY